MKEIFGVVINEKVIYIVLSLVIGYLTYKVLVSIVKRSLLIKVKGSKIDKRKLRTLNVLLNNIVKYTVVIAIAITILSVLGVNASAIIASIGVAGFAVGLAIQDTLKDIVAGIFILIENQYAIGDTIMVGNFKGEVIFLGLKSTKIRGEKGEVKILPNRSVTDIINYSLEQSFLFIDVALDYDNDEELVTDIFCGIVNRLPKEIKNIGNCEYLGIQKLDTKVIYRISIEADDKEHEVIKRQCLKKIKKELAANEVRR